MPLAFTKLIGAGNDFVLIDRRRKGSVSRAQGSHLAKKLCDRRFAVGADGVLVLESSRKADFRMRIFNPDGSEAEMCGNGSRCAAYYVLKGKKGHVSFETLAGVLEADVKGEWVRLRLTEPTELKTQLSLEAAGRTFQVHAINTGVPHAVLFADDLETVDVERIGREIRRHALFQPRGTNVDFVKPQGPNKISVRTYERGVEGETLACGTGVTASALMTALLIGYGSPIEVLTRGRDRLKIYFRREGNFFKEVSLEGKVSRVFEGRMYDV
ncbi:MAG: diaminopimelate epimerase [Candidatus Omnitrophota bacterium]